MPEVNIDGLLVHFPFEPYDAQINYMKKVVECLRQGANGVLESPTGTGKTLCLLCATLSWLQMRKAQQSLMRTGASEDSEEYFLKLKQSISSAAGHGWNSTMNIPKVIYSSRTHSQLTQVVRELLRTRYKNVKAVVIGSRDQLCLHPEVKAENNSFTKINLCKAKVVAKVCPYYNNVELKIGEFKNNTVADIEDLITKGKKHTTCPYYVARMLKDEADVVLMPYNYLVDPKARRANNISMLGNVIILDEAHNIGKMCEESVSFELKSRDIAACISEVTQVMKNVQTMGDDPVMDNMAIEDFTLSDLATLKTLLCELEDQIEAIPFPQGKHEVTFAGSYMFELLRKAELTANKKSAVLDLVDKVVQYLSTLSTGPFQSKGKGLQKLADMIRVVFNKERAENRVANDATASYKVHVKMDDDRKQGDVWAVSKLRMASKSLNYWCFNPGIGMEEIMEQNVHCLLLTSGTLSPLSTFASELKVPFPVSLENPHIIKDDQIWVGVFCVGPDGTGLNSAFRNRGNTQYVDSLGNAVLNFARVIPDGLLVFFPSYTVMKACQERWEFKGIWSSISQQKAIFVEPQDKDGFIQSMDQYYERINDPKFTGAIFMAVCRGKASEGLDFADKNGRAVIITGIPYPPFKDAKVSLKVDYMSAEHKKNSQNSLNGNDWYQLEATRAINQAVGRVIRHKDDYAAILFCDARFSSDHIKGNLSMWIRPHIKVFKNFGMGLKDVNMFFKKISQQPCIISKPACDLSAKAATPAHFTKALNWPLPAKVVPKVQCQVEDLNAIYSACAASTSHTASQVCDKEMSLFEALENPECSSKFLDFQFGNAPLKKASSLSIVGPKPKKKKLIIVDYESQSVKTSAGVQNLAESPAEAKKEIESALQSVMTKAIGEEKYETFDAAMKKYSADRDIALLCKTLVAVFDKPELHTFFFDVRKLVAAEHRSCYDKYLNNIVGKSKCKSTTENGAEAKNATVHEAHKNFISMVKQNIHPEKYKLFSSALKSYGFNRDVNSFTLSLIAVIDTPDKYSLFHDIRNYVEKSHRNIYDKHVRTVIPNFFVGD